mgnify:CR=1 FL=1|tara:strand:- start:658 stop:1053 length:396 start_codon:yes stop_codon:yes gene_type:complete
MKDLRVVALDELHECIRGFIIGNGTIIGDYEDMKTLILLMIRTGYMFNMDRDRLRDAMEDITYMLCPDDDANKDRVERGLEYEEDGSGEEDEEEEEEQEDRRYDRRPRTSHKQEPSLDESIEDIGTTTEMA